MELRHLRYFVALAEELHFGRAAARLCMSQPPLSQQIRQMEEELGVTLFERTKRHVEITEAGQVFLEGARRTLTQFDQSILAVQEAKRGEYGRLQVGFVNSATYMTLPGVLQHFETRFPNVQISLREMTSAQQIKALIEGQIDIGILRPPVQEPSLVSETILSEELVVMLPQQHPLAACARVDLAALSKEPFVLFPRQIGPGLYDLIMISCQQAGFTPQAVHEATHIETIIRLVGCGAGVALAPTSSQRVSRPEIAFRTLKDSLMIETAVAWRKDDRRTILQRFMDAVRLGVPA